MKNNLLIVLIAPKGTGKSEFGRHIRGCTSSSALVPMALPLHRIYAAFTLEGWGKYSKDEPWPEGKRFGVNTRRGLVKKLAVAVEGALGRPAMVETYKANVEVAMLVNRLVVVDDCRWQDELDMLKSLGAVAIGLRRDGVEWDMTDEWERRAHDLPVDKTLMLPTVDDAEQRAMALGRLARDVYARLCEETT